MLISQVDHYYLLIFFHLHLLNLHLCNIFLHNHMVVYLFQIKIVLVNWLFAIFELHYHQFVLLLLLLILIVCPLLPCLHQVHQPLLYLLLLLMFLLPYFVMLVDVILLLYLTIQDYLCCHLHLYCCRFG